MNRFTFNRRLRSVEQKILFLAKRRNGVTRKEAIATINKPESTIDTILRRLVNEKILKYEVKTIFQAGDERLRLTRIYCICRK